MAVIPSSLSKILGTPLVPNGNESCLEKKFRLCYQPQQAKQAPLFKKISIDQFESLLFYFYTYSYNLSFITNGKYTNVDNLVIAHTAYQFK